MAHKNPLKIQVRSDFLSKHDSRTEFYTEEIIVTEELHEALFEKRVGSGSAFWRSFLAEQYGSDWRLGIEALRTTLEVARMRLGDLETKLEHQSAVEKAAAFVDSLAAIGSDQPH